MSGQCLNWVSTSSIKILPNSSLTYRSIRRYWTAPLEARYIKPLKDRFRSELRRISSLQTKLVHRITGFVSFVHRTEFYLLTYSVALVRKRTIPTERPPLVGEVSANICGPRKQRLEQPELFQSSGEEEETDIYSAGSLRESD
jgi:hypothetical protein